MTPQEAVDKIKSNTGYECHLERKNPVLIQCGHSRNVTGWVFGYEDPYVISQNDINLESYSILEENTIYQSYSLENAVNIIIDVLLKRQKEIDSEINKELKRRIKDIDNAKTITFEELKKDMESWDKEWENNINKRIYSTFERHPEFGTVLKGTRVTISSLLRAFNLGFQKQIIAQFSGLKEEHIEEALEVLAISLVHRKKLP